MPALTSSKQAMHKSPPRARKPHRGQAVVKRKRKNVWIRYSLDCRVWFRIKRYWANVTLPSKLTMTDSSTHPRLPISTTAVKAQFARRGNLSDAQFLYAEVADRMLDRLKLIRMQPERILDAGCGAGSGITLLKNRYPSARLTGQDFNPTALAAAQKTHHTGVSGLLKKLTGKSNSIQWLSTDLADTGLAPESLDLIWSNLAIHWHPAPHDVLREWARIVKLNGLVFFSCFGPDTLKEVRQALVSAKLVTQTPAFVDMHDFGDLLVENGFGDPVMDQERLTLTYQSADKLLEDVRALGGNPSTGRRPGLVGRQWRKRLTDALEAQRHEDGTIHLSIEVAYGHAWRLGHSRQKDGETRISISAIGRKSK